MITRELISTTMKKYLISACSRRWTKVPMSPTKSNKTMLAFSTSRKIQTMWAFSINKIFFNKNRLASRITHSMRMSPFKMTKLMFEISVCKMWWTRMTKEFRCLDKRKIIQSKLVSPWIISVFSIRPNQCSRTFLKIWHSQRRKIAWMKPINWLRKEKANQVNVQLIEMEDWRNNLNLMWMRKSEKGKKKKN